MMPLTGWSKLGCEHCLQKSVFWNWIKTVSLDRHSRSHWWWKSREMKVWAYPISDRRSNIIIWQYIHYIEIICLVKYSSKWNKYRALKSILKIGWQWGQNHIRKGHGLFCTVSRAFASFLWCEGQNSVANVAQSKHYALLERMVEAESLAAIMKCPHEITGRVAMDQVSEDGMNTKGFPPVKYGRGEPKSLFPCCKTLCIHFQTENCRKNTSGQAASVEREAIIVSSLRPWSQISLTLHGFQS